jgi:hypothetical protein
MKLECGRVLAAALLTLSAGVVCAEEQSRVDQLSAQATDPTAALMSFQLNDWFTSSFHGLDDSANPIGIRAAYCLN